MAIFSRLFSRRAHRDMNVATYFARKRFNASNPGEAAAINAARLGCIAG